MKKFLAITASAVLAFGAMAFAACGEKEQDGAENLTYTEVDLSTAEKKSAFANEVSSKIDVAKLFGDANAENYSIGLAADVNFDTEISVSAKNFPIGETETKDLSLSAKLDSSQSAKIEIANGSNGAQLLGQAESKVKGKVNIPDELFMFAAMPDGEWISTLKSLISDFDYSLSAYLDNDYLYMQYPESIVEALPEEAQGVLPEGGKIKIPHSSTAMPVAYDAAEAPSAQDETAIIVGQVVEMLVNYDVKVAVSTQDGYAIKLSVDTDAVMNILGDIIGDKQTVAMLNQLATFNTCAVTAYLAVDEDGMFKEVSVQVELDATVKIAANLIEEGIPEINGAIKLNTGVSVKKFNGSITLPSDLDSYVDIYSLVD